MFSHGIFFSLLRARGNMFLTKVAGNCFVDFCVSSFFFQNPRFFCQKIIKSTSCHISFTFDIFQSFGEMEIQGRAACLGYSYLSTSKAAASDLKMVPKVFVSHLYTYIYIYIRKSR